ncbi:hypothetical protein [Variovorax sp. LG9.2]|uniref:hypothetical protein n=1 Tax=Variovorax sp. LG9.2 TaxID=3048626 RepID=UPI002B223251|nr:hypothetical protein [Variovorax sp. LG9.2]
MPTYSALCTQCGTNNTYVKRMKEFDANKTPPCSVCNGPTQHQIFFVPTFSTANLGEHQGFKSPHDGRTYQGHTSYMNHMKENGSMPASDYTGHAENVRRNMTEQEDKKRLEVIENVVKAL